MQARVAARARACAQTCVSVSALSMYAMSSKRRGLTAAVPSSVQSMPAVPPSASGLNGAAAGCGNEAVASAGEAAAEGLAAAGGATGVALGADSPRAAR
jgi:hypothetical protein